MFRRNNIRNSYRQSKRDDDTDKAPHRFYNISRFLTAFFETLCAASLEQHSNESTVARAILGAGVADRIAAAALSSPFYFAFRFFVFIRAFFFVLISSLSLPSGRVNKVIIADDAVCNGRIVCIRRRGCSRRDPRSSSSRRPRSSFFRRSFPVAPPPKRSDRAFSSRTQ